jgi:hypothetical protein
MLTCSLSASCMCLQSASLNARAFVFKRAFVCKRAFDTETASASCSQMGWNQGRQQAARMSRTG